MLHRFAAAARMLRPRVIAETSRQVAHTSRNVERLRADVRDLQRMQQSVETRHAEALLRIEGQLAGLQESHHAHVEGLEAHVTARARDVSARRPRESQLERYLYQFRIGPGRGQIRTLLAALPQDRRAAWEGKATDY